MKYFIIYSLYIAINFGQTWDAINRDNKDYFYSQTKMQILDSSIIRFATDTHFDSFILNYDTAWASYSRTYLSGGNGDISYGSGDAFLGGTNSAFRVINDTLVKIIYGNNIMMLYYYKNGNLIEYQNRLNTEISGNQYYSGSMAYYNNKYLVAGRNGDTEFEGNDYANGIIWEITPRSTTKELHYFSTSTLTNIPNPTYPGDYYTLLDCPVSIFENSSKVYVISQTHYVGNASTDSIGMGLKLWESTDLDNWTEIYEWDESDRVLEVQTLNNRAYVLIESTNRNSADKGIYKIYRGVVNKVNTNWADSLYIVGMTATTNDLMASVSSQTEDGEILEVNGFDVTTGWTIQTGIVADYIYNSKVNYSNSNLYLRKSIATDNTKKYKIKFKISDCAGGNLVIRLGSSTSTGVTDTVSGNGIKEITLTQTADRSYFYFQPINFTGKIDNLTIQEFTGNPAAKIDKLYKYVNGKWTFIGDQLFASNNIERIGNRLHLFWHFDRWNFTKSCNGASGEIDKFYYTDDIPATTQPELNNYFIGIGINK